MPTPRNVVMIRRPRSRPAAVAGSDVVEVGVGEPDPLQVGRIDDRSQRRHELVAFDDGAGVDKDGLGSMQDERVDRNQSEARDRETRRQHFDVGRRLVGRDHDRLLRG